MTPSKIRYILSGLKAEIRRETDRDRVRQLCIIGMHWSKELMMYIPEVIVEPGDRKYQTCSKCGVMKELNMFSSFTVGDTLYHQTKCKSCLAEQARNKTNKNILTRSLPKHRAISDI